MKKFSYYVKNNKWITVMLSIATILLLSAIIHRSQLDIELDGGESYVNSWWTAVVVLSMLGVLCSFVVNFLVMVYLLIRRRWKKLLITLGAGVLAFIMLLFSLQADAPTLIFMT